MISLTNIDHLFDLIMHLIAEVVTYFGSHRPDAGPGGRSRRILLLSAIVRPGAETVDH
jgi:hypothetical protein